MDVAAFAFGPVAAAMHILAQMAPGAGLRRFAKASHARVARDAGGAGMPPGQAIGGLRVMMEILAVEPGESLGACAMFDMATAARFAACFGDQPVPARMRGDVARDPGVARQALLFLGGAMKRDMAGVAPRFEPGMRGRQRPRTDHPLDHRFGAQAPGDNDQRHQREKADQPPHQ